MGTKPVVWLGNSRRVLGSFPAAARTEIGSALYRVQIGEDPPDWRPMPSVGRGVREIRSTTARDGRVTHRMFYVARFPEAVYVLHVFQKKTRATSRRDMALGRQRYSDMLTIRKEREDHDAH